MGVYQLVNQRISSYENYRMQSGDYFLWQKTTKTNSIASYKKYLSNYPQGFFYKEAQLRYDTLENKRIEKEKQKAAERKRLEEEKRKKAEQRKKQQLIKEEKIRKENEDWSFAKNEKSIKGFEKYLDNYPKGKYISEAKLLIKDVRSWELAMLGNNLTKLQEYIQKYPNGLFYDQAINLKETRINDEKAFWKQAVREREVHLFKKYIDIYRDDGSHLKEAANNIKDIELWNSLQDTLLDYENYLNSFDDGLFVKEVEEKRKSYIENEDKKWNKATEKLTIDSLTEYKEQYPTGRYIAEADITIREISTWEALKEKNNIESCNEYLKQFKYGFFRVEAEELINSLIQKEQMSWDNAEKEKSLIGYEGYLNDYPNGNFVELAIKRVASIKKSALLKEKYSSNKLKLLEIVTCLADIMRLINVIAAISIPVFALMFLVALFFETYGFWDFMKMLISGVFSLAIYTFIMFPIFVYITNLIFFILTKFLSFINRRIYKHEEKFELYLGDFYDVEQCFWSEIYGRLKIDFLDYPLEGHTEPFVDDPCSEYVNYAVTKKGLLRKKKYIDLTNVYEL